MIIYCQYRLSQWRANRERRSALARAARELHVYRIVYAACMGEGSDE